MTLPAPESHPRLLGIYAHPDDELFCSSGTFARYAAAGCEIMVVSATRGQAGQIRSANLATRKTLAQVREAELRLACSRVGVKHVECWDYVDGMLAEVDEEELGARVAHTIRAYRPDVVFTFCIDGAYGHPDHIAISRATTAACLRTGDTVSAPPRLFHAVFPRRGRLLQDHLVRWLSGEGPDFRGDPEFVHGLLLLAEAASALRYADDHAEVKWFPSGFPIVEQCEPAASLFLLLSGRADVVREDTQGRCELVAHVIAADNATCLVLTPCQPTRFEGRGEGARLVSLGTTADSDEDDQRTIRVGVEDFLQAKLEALAAYA